MPVQYINQTNNVGNTDAGVITASTISQIGAITVAGINTAAAIKMADLQEDIADKYQAMANENREFYNAFYVPLEKELVTKTSTAEKYKRDYDDVTIGQMQATIKAKFKDASKKANRNLSRYCTGARKGNIKDIVLAETTALINISSMALRYQEDREKIKNDLRWEQRSNVLKMGRDLQSQVVSYGQLANQVFGDLGSQAQKSASGAISWLGFLKPTDRYEQENRFIYNTSLNRPNVTPLPSQQYPTSFYQESVNTVQPLPFAPLQITPTTINLTSQG